MKKKFGTIILLCLILLFFAGMHNTTLRYVDKHEASIKPDHLVRLAGLPFNLKIRGYSLSGISYNKEDHLFIAKYKVNKPPLDVVRKAKYICVTFQPTTVPIVNKTQLDPYNLSRNYYGKQSGRDTLRILVGDSYNHYQVLSANYPAISIRDPSMTKIKDKYYIIYTRGLVETSDFEHWHQIKWPAIKTYDYLQDWAPEFVTAKGSKIYVVMSACKKGDNYHHLIISSFKNGHVNSKWKRLTGNIPQNVIDPDIQYANGQYYLFCKNENTRKLMMGVSQNVDGPYKMEKIKLSSSKFSSVEGPQALIKGNKIRLAFDTYNFNKAGTAKFYGLHYVEGNLKRKDKWSKVKKIDSPIIIRHGQLILN